MALTPIQTEFLDKAKHVALQIGNKGKALSGLIGELSACQILDLKWQPDDGFDAVDLHGHKFQVKTRKSWSTPKVTPRGRIGRFGRKAGYLFDEGVLVELNRDFDVDAILQLNSNTIEDLERNEGGTGLHVSTFHKHGTQIYPT
jgi:hypothetical protein